MVITAIVLSDSPCVGGPHVRVVEARRAVVRLGQHLRLLDRLGRDGSALPVAHCDVADGHAALSGTLQRVPTDSESDRATGKSDCADVRKALPVCPRDAARITARSRDRGEIATLPAACCCRQRPCDWTRGHPAASMGFTALTRVFGGYQCVKAVSGYPSITCGWMRMQHRVNLVLRCKIRPFSENLQS